MKHSLFCTSDRTVCIASWISICVVSILVVPFCIYATLKFYNIRQHQAIIRRYPLLLFVSSILNILYIFIIIQYRIIYTGISPRLSIWFEPIIGRPYLILTILMNILRIWLVNYDININMIQSRNTWQSQLASTVNNNEWYSRNRHKWNNLKHLMKTFVFIWIFLSLLTIIPLYLSHTSPKSIFNKASDVVYFIILTLLLLCAVAIWYKIPRLKDTFYILYEIKVLMISSILCYVALFFFWFFAHIQDIFALIQVYIVLLFLFIQIFVSEFMVINLINTKDTKHHKHVKMEYADLFFCIMASDIGIQEYFKHLQDEFCTENVLYFIEIMQWMKAIIPTDCSKDVLYPLSKDYLLMKFAKIIPISSINAAETDWYDKIEKIYQKYVDCSAELEINISYRVRSEFTRLIKLYKMKKEIEAGVYQATFIKVKATSRGNTKRNSMSFWNQGGLTSPLSIRIERLKKQSEPSIKHAATDHKQVRFDADPSLDLYDGKSKSVPKDAMVRGEWKTDETLSQDDYLTSPDTTERDEDIEDEEDIQSSETDKNAIIRNEENNVDSDKPIVQMPSQHEPNGVLSTKSADDALSKDTTHDIVVINLGKTSSIKDDEVDEGTPVTTAQLVQDTSAPVPTAQHAQNMIKDVKSSLVVTDNDTNTSKTYKPLSTSEEKTSNALHVIEEKYLDRGDSKLSAFVEDVLQTVDGIDNFDTFLTQATLSKTPSLLPLGYAYDVKRNLSTRSQSRMAVFGKRLTKTLSTFHVKRKSVIKKKISEYVESNEETQSQYVIDPEELKQMEIAATIDLSHLITVSCYATNQILTLNQQTLCRFRRSEYYQRFNDSVNLEKLLLSSVTHE